MRLETSAWCAPGIACALLVLQGACTLQDFDSLGTEWGVGAGGTLGGGGGAAGDGQGGAGPDAGALGGSGGTGEVPSGNLIQNPSFESGHVGWVGFGASTILDVSTTAHTGSRSIASKDRQEAWMGPSYDATDDVSPGSIYRISAWVRMETGVADVSLSFKSNCGADDIYTKLTTVQVSTEWAYLEAAMPVPNCDPLYNLSPYFEGPPPDAMFYVDDVGLELIP